MIGITKIARPKNDEYTLAQRRVIECPGRHSKGVAYS